MKTTTKLLGLLAFATIISSLIIFSYAYFFLYVPSTIQYTAVTPDVQFYRWSDGAKRNNITLTFNFAANVTTYEANATWGIRNSGGSPITVYNYIKTINDTTKITNMTIQILDGGSKAVIQWVTGDPAPPTTPQSWSASATTTYTLRIWSTGAASVSNITVTLALETEQT